MRVGPEEIARHRDGLSRNDPMLRFLVATSLFDRSQASAPDSSALQGQFKPFDEKMAATPAFFWLASEQNDRLTQLQVGRAYVRAQLAATAAGLSMHPLSQALQEYPEQKPHYDAIHRLLGADKPGQTVQMWVCLGYAPAVAPSPRRGLDALVSSVTDNS